MDRCLGYWDEIWEIWEFIYESKPRGKWSIEELIKPSSIEGEMRKIEDSDIKKLLDPWNCELENIISSFNEDHPEDKNGHVEKALQSLHQLFTPGFD